MIKLYFIRHGRQNSGLCNVDVPLDEAGEKQAELVAKRLKGYDIDRLYCSGLIRAKQTADIIGKELDLKDKFIKIRIRYSGEELAVIDCLNTIYRVSYA